MPESATGYLFRRRPMGSDDEEFLRILEADRLGFHRGDPVAGLQSRAREQGYRARFPDAEDCLILAGDEPAGRIMVATGPEAHHVVDVALLHRHRGRGIGTALLVDVQAGAVEAGVAVELSVLAAEARLLGWYERLGFTRAGSDGVHVRMVWEPGRG